MADSSWVEYAPYPYMWIENYKGRSNGLGLETEGLERKMDEVPEWDEKKIKKVCKTYPGVSFQLMGSYSTPWFGQDLRARKLFKSTVSQCGKCT